MVLDGALVSAGDEHHVGDPGRHRLLHRVLDQRLVNHRHHLFGAGLGGGQEAATQSRHRKHRLGNFGRGMHSQPLG